MKTLQLTRLSLTMGSVFILLTTACTKSNPATDPGSNGSNGSGGSGGSGSSTTSITYKNDAPSPVTITLGDTSATIAVAGSVTFRGKPGASVTGQATAAGHNTSGGTIGSVITWTLNDAFPSSGTTTKSLDVSSSYFFLRIANTSSYTVTGIYVNYGLTPQTFDNITLGSGTFDIGYYPAYTNSNIRCVSNNAGYWQVNTNLPGVQNQSFLFTLQN
jgi:hypothetical protein